MGSWALGMERAGLLCKGKALGLCDAALKLWSPGPSHRPRHGAHLTGVKDGWRCNDPIGFGSPADDHLCLLKSSLRDEPSGGLRDEPGSTRSSLTEPSIPQTRWSTSRGGKWGFRTRARFEECLILPSQKLRDAPCYSQWVWASDYTEVHRSYRGQHTLMGFLSGGPPPVSGEWWCHLLETK